MEPNSLPLLAVPKKAISLWLVVLGVFIIGFGAGMLLPAGLKLLGLNDSQVSSEHQDDLKVPMPTPLANASLRRVEAPPAPKPTAAADPAAAPAATVSKIVKPDKAQKPKQKLAVTTAPAAKKDKKPLAKIQKAAPVKAKATAPKAVVQAKTVKAAAPSADLIEEVPSALTAVQVERLMQKNAGVLARKQKLLARPVALPPSEALIPSVRPAQSLGALPILKSDPRSESKTYPVSINNAKFSKANLSSCSKRCALHGIDAMGNPIKALIDGPTYAASLMQHNGTINISGQPRIVKNQQVLLVENISFNLAPTQKFTSKNYRSGAPTHPGAFAAEEKTAGYTEVSFEGDDLKPGTVIKNRKQIPMDDQQELPAP